MPNEIQIECYFKSAEIAKLCQGSKDIVINFKASFPPDSKPSFEIYADSFIKGVKAGRSVKSATKPGDSTSAGGCPTPCR